MKRLLPKPLLPEGALSFALCALPLLLGSLLIAHFISALDRIALLEEQGTRLREQQQRVDRERERAALQISQLQEGERERIYNELLSLTFLQSEIAQLEEEGADNEQDREHLLYLREHNKLRFVEKARREPVPGYLEIEIWQKESVAMDADDLKTLLALLEGSPHFAITYFGLSKKKMPTEDEIYLVELHLLQRTLSPTTHHQELPYE